MTHYLLEELQEKLRSDDEIWDFLRQSCLDGMWYWDLETPENEWMSPEFWQLFGYDPAEMPHSPVAWQDIIHPDDLEVAKTNLGLHMEDASQPYDQIVRYRHADGRWIWVRCRGLAIRDDTGRAVRLLGAHSDLTEFVRQAEEQEATLRKMAARHIAVFGAVQSGIVGLDENRNIVTLNPPARHLLGGRVDETPFPWPDSIKFLQGEDFKPLDASADPINRALAGMSIRGEVHLMTRLAGDDEARYVRLSSAQVNQEDADIHTVIVLDDVSEQERHRQQLERTSRLDALGQLTGGIAHDFNNLLATILYAVDLAQKEQQSDRATRLLNGAINSIERGRQLSGRLLAFAKQQPGRPTTRSVAEIMREFAKLVEPTIEEDIHVVLPEADPDLAVYCDVPQLENALLNLVLNSRDAIMRSGKGGTITIFAREVSGSEAEGTRRTGSAVHDGALEDIPYVEFAVSDDGPGMRDEVRRRATDPFFTTKETNSGTGLGLSMVYGFARQAKGALVIYSEQGTGTTVRLVLPCGNPLAEPSETRDRPEAERGQGERILLVEDEDVLLSMMSETLEDLGYEVITSRSGRDAWTQIENGLELDAVVTDVVMPGGISGFDLTKLIKERAPATPVILLSGYFGYTAAEHGGKNAVVLQKPCMPEELARHLRLALTKTAAES